MKYSFLLQNKINHRGMTLLEVVIAMTLFSVIALYLMRITSFNIQYRTKVADHTHSMRLNRSVVQIFRKDFRNLLVIKPKDISYLLEDKARLIKARTTNNQKCKKELGESDQSLSSPPPPPLFTEPTEINELPSLSDYDKYCRLVSKPLSIVSSQNIFLGKPNEIRFFSLSYVRTVKDQLAGSENQIRYHISSCRKKSAQCLWREVFLGRNFSNSDPMHSVVLLKNVKTFKLSYFNIFDNQWKTDWLNKEVPSAVKIVLEFQNNKKQWVKEERIFPIHHRLISLKFMNLDRSESLQFN